MDFPGFVLGCGVHRSGTSVMMGLYEGLGGYGGLRERHVGFDGKNPRGFYENLSLSMVNRRLLSSLCCPPEEGGGVLGGVRSRDHGSMASHARGCLFREFGGYYGGEVDGGTFGYFKDPRTTVLLDFWLDIIGDVWIFKSHRSSEEVVRSMEEWWGIPSKVGYGIVDGYEECFWDTVYRRGIGDRVLVIPHSRVLSDPLGVCGEMASFVGMDVGGGDMKKAASLVDVDLHRNGVERPEEWWRIPLGGSWRYGAVSHGT
jgi:hypothetical protein